MFNFFRLFCSFLFGKRGVKRVATFSGRRVGDPRNLYFEVNQSREGHCTFIRSQFTSMPMYIKNNGIVVQEH